MVLLLCLVIMSIKHYILELHYSGESHATQHPQSFTCPLCGKLGFSESQLHSHVNRQHSLSQGMHQEVVSSNYCTPPGIHILCPDMSSVCSPAWQ